MIIINIVIITIMVVTATVTSLNWQCDGITHGDRDKKQA